MIHFKTCEDILMLMPLKTILEDSGISCFIKNEFSGGAVGELPYTDTLPELWLYDERDRGLAQSIIESLESEAVNHVDWTCPDCQERIEKEFQLCWQCGHLLSETDI